MAPSRAVVRNATITFAALRTSSRTSTSLVTRQLHHLSIARPIANTRTTLSTLYTRRFNSSEAASAAAAPESAAVEAPDYLDEKELHIFQKLNAELEPTKLEVCFPCSPHISFVLPIPRLFPCYLRFTSCFHLPLSGSKLLTGYCTGPRCQRRLRQYVRFGYCELEIQGLVRHQTT